MRQGCHRTGDAASRFLGMKAGDLIKNISSTIRFSNLAIICFSLYLVRFTIIKPILEISGLSSSIPDNFYMLMVFAIVMIAAAGYLINDFFDTGMDAINKPLQNKIGNVFSRKNAVISYLILNLSGIMASWYFGFVQGIRYPVLVFIFSAGLLYFYSSSYKKMLLAGNLVIAFLTSLTIWLSILFDHNALQSETVTILVSSYTAFAFIMTLIREMIKDCEDAAGDQAFGAATLPLMAGIKTTRIIISLFALLTVGAIIYIQVSQSQWENKLSFLYTGIFIQLPLLFLALRSIRAKTKADDHTNSRWTKTIMLTGLLSMLVFYISSN